MGHPGPAEKFCFLSFKRCYNNLLTNESSCLSVKENCVAGGKTMNGYGGTLLRVNLSSGKISKRRSPMQRRETIWEAGGLP